MKLGPVSSGLLDIMRDFAPWTSTHAIPHVFMAESLIIAIFWSIVFFAALALAIWQFYTVIARYLSFPINVDARSNFGIQPFPCITFCNANPWKLSEISGTPLEGLVQAYEEGKSNTQYGFDSPFSMREAMRAQLWTTMMFDKLKTADQNESTNIGYSLSDLVIGCTIAREPCDLKLTSDFYDAFYGHCHTFNPQQTINISRAGPNYGLRLQLRSTLVEYLPWTQTAGTVFAVHGMNQTPFEDVFGYLAEIGRATAAGVKYYERTKLGSPYDTCVKTDSTPNLDYYGNSYQIESCFRSCIQKQIISECGCYDPKYNTPSGSTATSCYEMSDVNTAIDCSDNIVDASASDSNTNTSTTFDLATDCDCVFSCNQSYYDVSMSQGLWPAKTYTPIECYNSSLGIWSTTEECKEWYGNNTVSLIVYYARMNWETDIESGAYDVISMIADTGGQIGLWLGMSIVSVVEFIIMFIILIMYIIIKPKRPDLKGFDYWAQFDKLIEENRNDDDPDLIYGDSDEEGKDALPPKVAEANKTMRVTELDAKKEADAKPDEKASEAGEAPKASEADAPKNDAPKTEDATPPTVTEAQPANAPPEAKPDDKK